MADSTMVDVSKLKVVDLRKELKSRGLATTGDKSELAARLHAAMSQEETQDDHGDGDINLSSDEGDIDSEGVLDDDDKSHTDILDDAVDTLNEELALEEQVTPVPDSKPAVATTQRTLKRKLTEAKENSEKPEQKEAKKIVLNRAASITSAPKVDAEVKADSKPEAITAPTENNRVKITADIDSKTRMEMRAKRFGLPVKMSDAERKEARKQRFGQSTGNALSSVTPTLSENIGKLKQRAEHPRHILLICAGDKSELAARLRAAMSQEETQDDHGDGC